MKPLAIFEKSSSLTRQLQNVFMPDISLQGTFEYLTLSNSNQFLIQYSRPHLSGRLVFGLGAAPNYRMAQIKAYAEFVERKAFLENSSKFELRTTNGIATHSFEILAERNAIDELYERDSFLMHWYSETPMAPIVQTEQVLLADDIQNTLNLGFQTRFYETYLGYQSTIACFLISKDTGGFCVGLSSGRGKKQNIYKAFLEASINLFLCKDGAKPSKLEFIDQIGLKHHRDFWLFQQTFPTWLLSTSGHIEDLKPQPIFKKMVLGCEHFSTIAVKSMQLLDLNVGSATSNDIEIVEKRLVNKTKNIKTGKNLIHPIP